jgi:hypothetical protein
MIQSPLIVALQNLILVRFQRIQCVCVSVCACVSCPCVLCARMQGSTKSNQTNQKKTPCLPFMEVLESYKLDLERKFKERHKQSELHPLLWYCSCLLWGMFWSDCGPWKFILQVGLTKKTCHRFEHISKAGGSSFCARAQLHNSSDVSSYPNW